MRFLLLANGYEIGSVVK